MVTASFGNAAGSGNYAIANPVAEACDAAGLSDRTFEVKVYNKDGGLEDGKFTLGLF